ncbi:ergothioneine biosynthesis glutamate--cysteine ligase EgtA [Nakamurella sp. GG22]
MRTIETLPTDTTPTEVHPPLSEAAAEAWIPRTCFKNGPPGRIGVELELLVVDAQHPDGLAMHYPEQRYPALLRELADGDLDGRLTVEPGGQVELSSRPGHTLQHTVATVRRDLAALRRRADRCGARLAGIGVDPIRPPRRTSDHPRYVAMERYLDPWGPAARTMMCSTASVQVNVEAAIDPAGPGTAAGHGVPAPADASARWDLLHAVGPALVAGFANSAYCAGRPTGWKSYRQAVWMSLDPCRTGGPVLRSGEDLAAAWTRWVLDAPLMLVRRDTRPWAAPAGVSFRDWVRLGSAAVPDRHPPTADDLAYHLTTLFPHVRPKGYLEIRYIDAQPGGWWAVPTAVVGALLEDGVAAERAREACAPIEGRWRDAARLGVGDQALRRAANEVLLAGAAALRRNPDTVSLAEQVEGYIERWTARGRCPADDPPDLNSTASSTTASLTDSSRHQGDEPS